MPHWVGENVRGKQHQLLLLLWRKGEVRIVDLMREIYAARSGHEAALDKVKERLNARLAAIGQPLEVCMRRREVFILQEIGGDADESSTK